MYKLLAKTHVKEIKIQLWKELQNDYFEVWINGKLDAYFCDIDKALIHIAKRIKEEINVL